MHLPRAPPNDSKELRSSPMQLPQSGLFAHKLPQEIVSLLPIGQNPPSHSNTTNVARDCPTRRVLGFLFLFYAQPEEFQVHILGYLRLLLSYRPFGALGTGIPPVAPLACRVHCDDARTPGMIRVQLAIQIRRQPSSNA